MIAAGMKRGADAVTRSPRLPGAETACIGIGAKARGAADP